MALDPFEQLKQDTAKELEALRAGRAVTTIPGSPPIISEPPTGLPTPVPGPVQGGNVREFREDPGRPRFMLDTQVPIPTQARDPIQVLKEKTDFELAWDRQQAKRGPKEFGGPAPWRFLERMGSTTTAALADATGETLEAVGEGLRHLGINMFNDPKTATQQVHDFLNRQGIATRRYEGIAGRLGAATPEAAVQAAAWIAAAPYLLATRGNTVLSRLGQDWGRLIQRNPGLIATQELGAVTGARYGAEEGGPFGSLIGAVTGGAIAGLGHGLVKGAGRMVGDVVFGKTPLVPHGAAPIREALDPEIARLTGEQEIGNARRLLEGQIQAIIRRAAQGRVTDPHQASATFVREAEGALSLGRNIERHYWNQARVANQGVQVETEPLNTLFATMRAETPATAIGTLPNALMRRVERIFAPPPPQQTGLLGPNGLPLPPPPPQPWRLASFDEAMKLHSTILKRIAFERKAPARGREINRELIAAYTRIDDQLLTLVQNAAIDNPAIHAARNFSRTLNELFTRGPMAQVLGFAGRRERVVDPDLAIQRLLRDYEGLEQVTQIPGAIPISGPRALAAAEEAVRAQFRAAVEEAGPEGAARIMGQIGPAIRPLGTVYRDLTQAANELTVAHETLQQVRSHALNRFTVMADGRPVDVQTAISRLFSSPSGPTDARRIMRVLQGNPDAEGALKAGMVDHLVRTTDAMPSRMADRLADPKTRRLMEAVFEPGELARFGRLAEMGRRIEMGDEKFLAKVARGGLPIFARIFGAQVGRTVAQFTGGGTVQTPGIIAGVTKNWVVDAIKGIPVNELMARAVLDPRWERVLLSRVPETPKEVRAFIPVLKRLIRYTNAGIASWRDARETEQRRFEEEGPGGDL